MSTLSEEILGAMNESPMNESFNAVSESVRRTLSKVRIMNQPRKKLIADIVSALKKDHVFMDWLSASELPRESLRDVLGETIAQWKDDNDISDNDDYDALSLDRALQRPLLTYAKSHRKRGAKLKGINWTQVSSDAQSIRWLLDRAMQREDPKDIAKLAATLDKMSAALKK